MRIVLQPALKQTLREAPARKGSKATDFGSAMSAAAFVWHGKNTVNAGGVRTDRKSRNKYGSEARNSNVPENSSSFDMESPANTMRAVEIATDTPDAISATACAAAVGNASFANAVAAKSNDAQGATVGDTARFDDVETQRQSQVQMQISATGDQSELEHDTDDSSGRTCDVSEANSNLGLSEASVSAARAGEQWKADVAAQPLQSLFPYVADPQPALSSSGSTTDVPLTDPIYAIGNCPTAALGLFTMRNGTVPATTAPSNSGAAQASLTASTRNDSKPTQSLGPETSFTRKMVGDRGSLNIAIRAGKDSECRDGQTGSQDAASVTPGDGVPTGNKDASLGWLARVAAAHQTPQPAYGSQGQAAANSTALVSPVDTVSLDPMKAGVHDSATIANATEAAGQGATVGHQIPAAGASGIDSARLMQTLYDSEMRVGFHSAEFGSVVIRTSITQQQMISRISLQHADLGQTIAMHVPGLEMKLGTEYGLHARIEVHEQGAMLSPDPQSSSQQQQRTPRQSRSKAGQRADLNGESIAVLSAIGGATHGQDYQLDVHA